MRLGKVPHGGAVEGAGGAALTERARVFGDRSVNY